MMQISPGQFVIFEPLVPLPMVIVLALIVGVVTIWALYQRLSGWHLRFLAAVVVLIALLGPQLERQQRQAQENIAIVLEDRSTSQGLSDRGAQTDAAIASLSAEVTRVGRTRIHRVKVPDGPDDTGTRIMDALNQALAEIPQARISGIFVISDGIGHDFDRRPKALPAPLHLLRTGRKGDWDRNLFVDKAPAFAILNETINLTLKIEDHGAVPKLGNSTKLFASVDGAKPLEFTVPVGQDIEVPITLTHAGRNVIEFFVPEEDGEITGRNNRKLIQINGVRDRLRVLLVSGKPHPGGRTWRNLLKSDSSVDLVHFTILRPPNKQDGVPTTELSLIAFPTRELFLDKIDDFDLIIFDRYRRRGILPSIYLENVRNYVRKGGAVLVAAGPDFATAESLYRTPLSEIIPGQPTARVIDKGFVPTISDQGLRHPVTSVLRPSGDQTQWGRWLRQIEVTQTSGTVLMTGADDKPLLIVDRVGDGRIALLASDHSWLWGRGYEGGGPQLEMLRRLSHWMMKEPELEEEALVARPQGNKLRITRRTLAKQAESITVTLPDGTETSVALSQVGPGQFEGVLETDQTGLFRLSDGKLKTVVGMGPASPREFVKTIATDSAFKDRQDLFNGGVFAVEEELPSLRWVREGRPTSGRGWLGMIDQRAFQTEGIRQIPLLPAWLALLLAGLFLIGAWMREGRRR